jgi:hypothetical protein
MGLSDTPGSPACPSRASGWVHAPAAWGFPCCVRSPCTDMPSPLPRWDHRRDSCRSPRETCDSGLPHPFAGSAPTLRVSRPARRSLRVTACLLAESPEATLSIEGFGSIVTSTAAPIATGWSDLCRVGIAPTEDRRLFTAHKGAPYIMLSEGRHCTVTLLGHGDIPKGAQRGHRE